MDDEEFERTIGGAHSLPSQLIGAWQGTTKTWFEPDELADESGTLADIRPLLDGRFVVNEYEDSLMLQDREGRMT